MIEIIPNQSIHFNLVQDAPACPDVNVMPFCQLINPLDANKFQIKSLNSIVNGSFTEGLEGWESGDIGITAMVTITNESAEGECDGEVTITPSGGVVTGLVQYKFGFNGLTPTGNDASITYTGLCDGDYYVTIEDKDGNQTSVEFTIGTNIDCGLYDSTDELLPFETNQLLNCLTSDFI